MLYAMFFRCVADTQATADALVPAIRTIVNGPDLSYMHRPDWDSGTIQINVFKNFATDADRVAAKASIASKLSEAAYNTKVTSPVYKKIDNANSAPPISEHDAWGDMA